MIFHWISVVNFKASKLGRFLCFIAYGVLVWEHIDRNDKQWLRLERIDKKIHGLEKKKKKIFENKNETFQGNKRKQF